ncbi:3-dehydro-L-gulonate 2-dehydrogenase [Paenibacillus sp. LHD-38]|uniref:3-dehydro-L-gulonate 2-dehydrogenase n=1 Tax=Paenibacillus sp. LHD-38 TaxID=3072143 RepID=UPI00280C9838|nr:3-dehydro-L-gulonate 2-dehydrogenase [Paenibacillus sp. LHD-38]MDQ8736196.1 3-dehydro-L-gulonate 2-dehydrogenase [Paenibacillus sp. LHD-38]
MALVAYEQLLGEIKRVLIKYGVNEEKASLIATIYAENSLVGVYSHGANIFVNTCKRILEGTVNANAEPEKIGGLGGFERWEGNKGLGPYNSYTCAMRAAELAKEFGIGCVSLRNNNHWGRAGKYSSLIADQGMIGICATNGTSCMATWGGTTSRIGNNPLTIAVPREGGNVAVDMAFSQFSFGQLNNHKVAGKSLPVLGGYDESGEMTTDPAQVMETRKLLPVGYWKGAALATLIDLVVSCASTGNTTKQLDEFGADINISQIYIAINFAAIGGREEAMQIVEDTIAYVKDTEIAPGFESVRFPGQSLIDTKEKNLKDGIPLNDAVWENLLSL